jgi:hypothetical protein
MICHLFSMNNWFSNASQSYKKRSFVNLVPGKLNYFYGEILNTSEFCWPPPPPTLLDRRLFLLLNAKHGPKMKHSRLKITLNANHPNCWKKYKFLVLFFWKRQIKSRKFHYYNLLNMTYYQWNAFQAFSCL